MNPLEYALGDNMYFGCPEFLTEFKGNNLRAQKLTWNHLLQWYRGRNEHIVPEVKHGRKALCLQWRGWFAGLAAIL